MAPFLAARRSKLVNGMCSMLPYGMGICCYASIFYFKFVIVVVGVVGVSRLLLEAELSISLHSFCILDLQPKKAEPKPPMNLTRRSVLTI